MFAEIKADHESERAAMSKVAELLGIGTPETVRSGAARVRSTPTSGPG